MDEAAASSNQITLLALRVRLMLSRVFARFTGASLRARAVRGASWTVVGFGSQQLLKLASNLIMTRLLFPEAFGLMALASVFMTGLQMFSDVGIQPSIVRSKRGADPAFLNTAWTLQIIRGFLLWSICCALAYPAAKLYHEPLLFPILCLIGATSVIRGFQTTGYATSNRNLQLGRITVVDITSQVVGALVMVLWAWLEPTVWALVGGGITSAAVNVVLAHVALNTHRHRLQWERAAVRELITFGKWIFFATALTYLGGQGLRLVQGLLVPVDVLGMISIAGVMALAVNGLIGKISGAVLFPVFSQTHRADPLQLGSQLIKARKYLFFLTAPLFVPLILFSHQLVALLYDSRYQAAGIYLMIVATGAAMSAIRYPFGMTLLAVGDSASHMLNMSAMAVFRIAGVAVGYHYDGVVGMLIGDVIGEMCLYPVEAWRLSRHRLWFPLFDLTAYIFYACIAGIAYSVIA